MLDIRTVVIVVVVVELIPTIIRANKARIIVLV